MDYAPPKALVLVVEDNEDVRNIVTICLRRNGYAVVEAADGSSALEAFSNTKPDLILLDVLLPELDGIEVLKRLRAMETGNSVPVVMMSAVLQTRDLKAETARLNVASFLQKPFQMRKLLEHVERGQREVEPTAEVSHSQPLPTPSQEPWSGERRVQMSRRPFALKGDLTEVSVPEILHSVFFESRTGQLRFYSGITEKFVFFSNGLPVYAESSIPEETLGSHLVQTGHLSPQQHEIALKEMTSSGRHFGEVLLKFNFLGPHELFVELEAHLTEKVISTYGWNEGTYRFDEGDDWKEDVIVARMKPGRIMLDGIQKYWTPAQIQRIIRITDVSSTFPLDASPYSEDQLGLSTQETRLLQMVKRGLTVREIVKQIGDLNLTISTLFALYTMEHLGFVLAPKLQKSPTTSSTSDNTAIDKNERAKMLLAEYLKFRTADYFKLLGVQRDASNEMIKKAFTERQHRYHPDTLIGIDTGLVHEKVEELFVRIHNAYRTLIDPRAREHYLMQLEKKAGDSPAYKQSSPRTGRFATIKKKTQDTLLFEEGFSLLRSGNFVSALDFFSRAEELSPKPQYLAYRVWTSYLIDPEKGKKKTEKTLLRLRNQNEESALFPYLLGNMALKERNSKRAAMFFEQAVSIDPQHIDSCRQLRIIRMRQNTTEVSGLFDLFKKK
jgi:two-component system, OmpR family, response regulator